jgi:cytochrome c556
MGQERRPTVDSDKKPMSPWMDTKVKESQKIFVALAEADFKTVIDSAKKLKTLNKFEGFVRRNAPGYRTQLRSFEFAVDEIEQQARKENIEGVTLGFHQLTMSCVNCHKQLRRSPKDLPAKSSKSS